MTDPVTRLEAWCDRIAEYYSGWTRQTRVGDGPWHEYPHDVERKAQVAAYRAILTDYQNLLRDVKTAKTRSARHGADCAAAQAHHIIYLLADAHNPETP
jgi:hypothetical protein